MSRLETKVEGGVLYRRSDKLQHGLVIAIHGGGFDHRYFDIPGFSTIEAMLDVGLSVFAVDRPGYGASETSAPNLQPIANSVPVVAAYISKQVVAMGISRRAILLGHSIGGVLALSIAAGSPDWLAGVTVSGVGDRPSLLLRVLLPTLPRHGTHSRRSDRSQRWFLFGRSRSFDPSVVHAIDKIGVPAPFAEGIEAISDWPRRFPGIAAGIRVPIQFALADSDRLWNHGQEAVKRMAGCFSNALRVEGKVLHDGGHLYEFHHGGAKFIEAQRTFALSCLYDGRNAKVIRGRRQ